MMIGFEIAKLLAIVFVTRLVLEAERRYLERRRSGCPSAARRALLLLSGLLS
jgi:hypothetical protein